MSERNNQQAEEKDEDGIQLENKDQGDIGVETEPDKETGKKMRINKVEKEKEDDLSLFFKDDKNEKEKSKPLIWFIVLIFSITAGISGAFLTYNEYGREKKPEEKKESIVLLEKKGIEEAVQEDPDKKEIPVTEDSEAIPDSQKIQKKVLTVKVFNGGSVPGSAGNIMNFLISQGYAKANALNAETSNHIGAAVYFSDDNLKSEAENIQKLLKEKKIDVLIKKADSAEQKSADIVVMLGK